MQNVHHLFKGSWRSILGAFLWCSQSNTNFPFFHAEIKGTNWWLSTQQPQHWIPCFTCTPLQSPTHLPQVHIQKPMKTGLGWGDICSSWWSDQVDLQSYTVVYSTYPNVPPLFWWIQRFSFMCCNKVGHFSMPVDLVKRPRFRIYMSHILLSSEIVDGLLGPTCTERKYLGFGTSSLLQHALPLSTLRKTVSGNKYWRELGIPGFLQPLLWNRLRHKWLLSQLVVARSSKIGVHPTATPWKWKLLTFW